MLSARTAEALAQSRSALADRIVGADRRLSLPDAAYTLARRRQGDDPAGGGRQRSAGRGSGAGRRRARQRLRRRVRPEAPNHTPRPSRFPVPGPGCPAHRDGTRPARVRAGVRRALRRVRRRRSARRWAIDLRAEVFDGAGRNLERTDRAQPALFAVEYALAKLVQSYGVRAGGRGRTQHRRVRRRPTVAGVFDLPTAVKAVSMRARLMHASPRGVMVAVALSPEAIAEYLSPDVDLAAVNDPGSCVVAGSDESIRKFQDAPRRERASWLAGSARRMRSIRG